ncbi:hypothetical protein LVD15_09045 [Fulvivirga maritima]|uniref:hypothetical protein n=1 Tax=Fulvivirga maritima TaxID=2904247 RepID=UPI001F43C56F|nr:hypothetical protein [Fulvivirga maritima]UII28560.1 hypothetical protein LVD15_09045 [Fulvivirga maritima]
MKFHKIMIGALAIVFSAAVSTNATTIKTNNDAVVVKVDPKKTEISATELPIGVKKAIVDGEFSKWSIAKAYKITYDESTPTTEDQVEYEVHFQNKENEKEIEVYTNDGDVIEE